MSRTCPPSAPAEHAVYERLNFPLSASELSARVLAALHEDRAFEDVTSIATVLSDRRALARLVARQGGVICGVPLAVEAFRRMDPKCVIHVEAEDGDVVARETTVLSVSGHARLLLGAERVALNFMQRCSGVASLTARFVNAIAGTDTRVLDTRKTTPGWRALEKYAVRAGGGTNHRFDLASAVLIKDNHLIAVQGDVALAVRRSREVAPPGATVEVECDRIDQVMTAVDAGADIILLDNMDTATLRACVELIDGRAQTEASGGVTLDTVRAIAETGVTFVSVGALTHSAPALNLALDFD